MALLTNDIYIGSVNSPLYHFTNRSIEAGGAKGQFGVDTIGNELSIDTFEVVIRYAPNGTSAMLYAPVSSDAYNAVGNQLYAVYQTPAKDFLRDLPYGTPVFWFNNSTFFAKGYLKSVDRVGKYSFKLTCISGVGLLDTKMHTGGLYTGDTLRSIVQSIIGGTLTYTIANNVKNVQVYGHLPYDTARNNLHRLLFSCGAAMMKGTQSTDYNIAYLSTSITTIPASRVAMGGTINYQLPSNKVEITEHGFFQTPNDTEVVLYDNTNSTVADNLTVIFENAPAYDLQVTGSLTIISSGVNHAVVSGVGTLTGKMYTHTRQIVTMEDNSIVAEERVRRVTDNELISSVNSRNVARRVLSFFKSAKSVNAKININSEKCGQLLKITDPFDDITQGFLQRMDIVPTSVKGANCEILEGYVPGNEGNNYLNRVFVSSSGTWTVPSGITEIRIVLVGGGQGGTGGASGEAGEGGRSDYGGDLYNHTSSSGGWEWQWYAYSGQGVPNGGVGGDGGVGGNIAIYDKTVVPGETITLGVGVGGMGGTGGAGSSSKTSAAGTSGTIGGATTASSTSIGSISSDDGLSGNGYYDPFTGNTYGITGTSGIDGGVGGQTDITSLSADSGTKGRVGGNVGVYVGGNGGNGYIYDNEGSLVNEFVSGGGGGGAAYGANGGNGGNYSKSGFRWYGGNGGVGATAVAPIKATYGNGGTGGNGGGAGGNGAGGTIYESTPRSESVLPGSGGDGGSGSSGGDGGDGCIIIYY